MRYILFILIFSAQFATAQIRDFQNTVKPNNPDSLYFMMNDTNSASAKYGLGKWIDADSIIALLAPGGGGTTNLSIGQSGGTQVIQSSTGTDVGVRNLYGLLITEGATDTLHFRVDSSLFATAYDITQIPISSLKAATATNTINNANYAQEWQWNTLAGTSGLKLSSTSTAAASNLQKLFEAIMSGTNATGSQTTTSGHFENNHAGSGTNRGIYVSSSNGSFNNAITAVVTGSSDVGVLSSSSAGIALQGSATSGTGLLSSVSGGSGLPMQLRATPSSTNTIMNLADFSRQSSGTPAAGIGGSITFTTGTATSSAVSNTISSKWTTATHASRVSDCIISGVNAGTTADLLTLKGDGKTVLNKYGVGSFTGTPVADLFVTATGEIIEGSMTGQSWLADADDATAAALISNQTLKFGGAVGIVTDLFNNAATDSITIAVDGSEWTTTSIYESDDWMQMYDSGSSQLQRISQANYITELNSLLSGAADGNGIYDGDGTTPTDVDVTMTDNIRFGTTTDNDFFIDGTNDRIGIGTGSPSYGLHVLNDAGCAIEQETTGNAILKIEGKTDGAGVNIDESTLQFSYTDADYAGGVEQTGASVILGKQSDAAQWTTLKMTMNEATDADVFVAEKNVDFTNTTESHVAINAGMAYTQNFDYSTSADLDLDRSYYTINVTGGIVTDTIKLPEVASTTDNWDNTLTSTQCQVGQEYVITNFRSATNVVISAHNPTSGNSDLINTQTNTTAASAISIPANSSVQVKCVRLASGVGYWYSY